MAHAFTAKQGQYLAFIHHYTRVNGRPPAQADMARHFRVSAPVVHQMILVLEGKGLLARTPTEARSVRVLVPPDRLPELSPSPDPTSPIRRAPTHRQRPTPRQEGEAQGGETGRRGEALRQLRGHEAVTVLRALLEKHPDLAAEAGELAASLLAGVSVEDVADAVEQALRSLSLDNLSDRAGRKRHGYVEPTQAVWDLIGEAVQPFREDIRRRAAAGECAAALATAAGVILGLYRVREARAHEVLGWAPDAPAEIARETITTLRESVQPDPHQEASSTRDSTLPAVIRDAVPEWSEMLERRWNRPR